MDAPAQVKAFRILVNRSATWADWDEQLLAVQLAELQKFDFDLSLTGFDSQELDAFRLDEVIDEDVARGYGQGIACMVLSDFRISSPPCASVRTLDFTKPPTWLRNARR